VLDVPPLLGRTSNWPVAGAVGCPRYWAAGASNCPHCPVAEAVYSCNY